MLQELSRMVNFQVQALDGPVGRVRDILVDAEYWIVRSVVVDLPPEHGGTSLLVTPDALKVPQWKDRVLPLKVSVEELARFARTDRGGRPGEAEGAGFWRRAFGWPLWLGSDVPLEEPPAAAEAGTGAGQGQRAGAEHDEGMQSCRSICGFRLSGTDREAGKLSDLLVSDVKWVIRYLLIETGTWPFRRKVMVVPEQVDRINTRAARVHLRVRAEEVQQSQEYDRHDALRPVTTIQQRRVPRRGRATGRAR